MSPKNHPASPPNVEVSAAASAVLAALPAIAPYRTRAARLPDFDIRCFDTLAVAAVSALEANHYCADTIARASAVVRRRAVLAGSLRTERTALRRLLEAAAASHVIDRAALDRIATAQSHIGLVAESRALVDLCDAVASTGVSLALGDDARFDRVLGLAAQLESVSDESEIERSRENGSHCRDTAFARLAAQYAEVRRAIEYLRPRDLPLDAVAPSLYIKRSSGRAPAGEDTA